MQIQAQTLIAEYLARLVLGGIAFVQLSGCTTTIRPPTVTREPTTVYLVDYRLHASVFLPGADGGYTEFAYGDWNWFAENRESVLDALRIVLLPGEGTLGRRAWSEIDAPEALKSRAVVQAVYPLQVERLRAEVLLRRLNDEFERERTGALFNDRENMTFVPHRDCYWLGWNCNTAASAWLEALDCEVRGPRLFAEFRIEAQP